MAKISGGRSAPGREAHKRAAISLLLPFAKLFSNDHEKT